MQSEFEFPIGYLEITDFDPVSGLLKSSSPTLVMIQASYCPACTQSKEEFRKLAGNQLFEVMTLQIDGERESEKATTSILDRINPNVNTIPSFVFFSGGRRVQYSGTGRRASDLRRFVEQQLKAA
jgi:hypothetical protein